MNHIVNVTPEGMKTEKGRVIIKARMATKEHHVYEVLRAAKALVKVMAWKDGRERIAAVLAEYHYDDPTAGEEADLDFIQPLLDSIQDWEEANDNLLKAIAGQPTTTEEKELRR